MFILTFRLSICKYKLQVLYNLNILPFKVDLYQLKMIGCIYFYLIIMPTQFRHYSLFIIHYSLERSESDNSLCHHSICNFYETCNVSTCNEVITKAVFFSSCCRMVMNIFHNLLKSCVNFFSSPVVSH